jgi:alkylation response protein AidB-like acyl-CoA dehydrogenase
MGKLLLAAACLPGVAPGGRRLGDGWRVAMTTLGNERGVRVSEQCIRIQRELDDLISLARNNGQIGNRTYAND